jgi:GNAT superfamily N-acetyltransferase
MTTIRPATSDEGEQVAATAASAFSDDPLFRWMLGVGPGVDMEPKLRTLFGAMVSLDLREPDHLVFTADDRTGVAVWKAPNQWKAKPSDMLRLMPTMLRVLGTKATRMLGAFNAIEKTHPKDEHYYLEALGTRQDMQSKGIGSAVIRSMLDRCDAEGMPAYLESSNVRNVPFYARHGFVATGEIVVGKGAPTVTAMWRDPR